MITNYLKLTLRHLRSNAGYTAVKILGLSIGMACFLLILLFVGNEYNTNRQFEAGDRIYRVNSIWQEQGGIERLLSFSPLAEALRNEFAGVENAMRYTAVDADFLVGATPFRAPTLIADPELFEMFDFTFLHGERISALRAPNSVVLSEREARRFFGRTDVVGETIRIAGFDSTGVQDFKVTGVLASPGQNSVTFIGREEHRVIIPFANAHYFFDGADFDTNWGIYNTVSYVQLYPGADPDDIEAQLPALLRSNLPRELKERVSLVMEPLPSVYLNENGGAVGRLIRLLLFIAIVILSIACFNFVNLSISLAVVRSKEIGLRKVMGAEKKQLIAQFIGESLVVSILSMAAALCMANILLPFFNGLVDRELALDFGRPWLWGLVAGITLMTGVTSGAYPAFIMTAIQPIRALKELIRTGAAAMRIRRALVVIQFVAATGLIVATMCISRQASYIAGMDVGFDKDRILVVSSLPRTWTADGVQQLGVIKQRVEAIPGVEATSIAWGPPGPRYTGQRFDFAQESGGASGTISVPVSHVDAHFLDVTGIDLVAGTFFDVDGPNSDVEVVLNETAARALGWEESATGQQIFVDGTPFRVKGVVADYNTAGLENPIGPVALIDVRQFPLYRELLIRVQEGAMPGIHEQIADIWREVYPGVIFETYFVEQQWEELHRWIVRTEEIALMAAGISILIALLGMFGLVSISVSQRTREIGIRKVLGASVLRLVQMLSREYLALVVIAFTIASPLVYIAMLYWLERFANRIDIGLDVFVFTGAATLMSVLLTVGIQAFRASEANPVETLRHE